MKRISYQVIFGAILLILGVLLLLNTAEIYDTSGFVIYIPSLFVLLGLYGLVKSGFQSIGGPLILIAVFGTIQLIILEYITTDYLLPIIIIAIGIGFLLSRFRRPTSRAMVTDTIDLMAIFGGVETRCTSQSFQGGEASAIFGGVDLDLREAVVRTPPAEIQVVALFGGIDIRVPDGWEVRMNVVPILGGAEDERPRRNIREAQGADDETRREKSDQPDLIVNGFVAFGGLSIND